MDAVAILPEEIWRMIFEYLITPDDLWRCSNTCDLFTSILSKWRTAHMMEIALPHLYRHLPPHKLLECRLVCKGWDSKVINFLEDHPSLLPHSPSTDPRRLDFINPILEKGMWKRNTYNFWNQDCSPVLPVNFKKGNPFIGRYVTLIMCRGHDNKPQEESLTKFYDKLCLFLCLYGQHIFYLNFWSHTKNYTRRTEAEASIENSRFAQLVTNDLFHFLPNLRKLRFGGMYYPRYDHGLNEHIPPESLPPASMLHSLEAEDKHPHWRSDPVTIALMERYHNQLRKLQVTTDEWNGLGYSLDWQMLTELYLTVNCKLTQLCGMQLRCPLLSKLGFDLAFCRGIVSFDKLMQVISEITANTRFHTVRLAGLEIEAFGRGERIRLEHWKVPPTLETLELENLTSRPQASYYSFLLLACFPGIKNLHLFLRQSAWKCQGEVQIVQPRRCVSFVSYSILDDMLDVNQYLDCGAGGGNMYKCNIWELMPHLNVFSVQGDVYTRDGYMEYWRMKRLRFS